MFGGLLAILVPVAILLPVFYQAHVGPKFGIDSVPASIQAIHRNTGRWPDSFAELKAYWRGKDRLTHRAAFIRLGEKDDEAVYAVAFDGRLGTFRIAAEGRPEPISSAVSGTLGP